MHRFALRNFLVTLLCAFALVGASSVVSDAAPRAIAAQQSDTDVSPGNPVVGSDRPGDVEEEDTTRYGLWVLLALCLIAAGLLLVRIERWERRRSGRDTED